MSTIEERLRGLSLLDQVIGERVLLLDAANHIAELEKLPAECDRLADLLYKAGICKDCGVEFSHDVTEPFADCPKGCWHGEDMHGPPTIQKLRMHIAELEKDRESFRVALEASYQMYHHTIHCPACIAALVAGGNLCDEHRTLVVSAVNKRDAAIATKGED